MKVAELRTGVERPRQSRRDLQQAKKRVCAGNHRNERRPARANLSSDYFGREQVRYLRRPMTTSPPNRFVKGRQRKIFSSSFSMGDDLPLVANCLSNASSRENNLNRFAVILEHRRLITRRSCFVSLRSSSVM